MMPENELLAFTAFLMEINDSVLDEIGFRTLCRNELWSETMVSLCFSWGTFILCRYNSTIYTYIYA